MADDGTIEGRIAARILSELEPLIARLAKAEPRTLDDAGVRALLGVSQPTLRKVIAEGMPYLAVGDVRRYEAERVLEWARRRGDMKRAG